MNETSTVKHVGEKKQNVIDKGHAKIVQPIRIKIGRKIYKSCDDLKELCTKIIKRPIGSKFPKGSYQFNALAVLQMFKYYDAIKSVDYYMIDGDYDFDTWIIGVSGYKQFETQSKECLGKLSYGNLKNAVLYEGKGQVKPRYSLFDEDEVLEKVEYITELNFKKRGVCIRCGKPLQAIGNRRKNGTQHDDWIDRKLHKKCWKAL